MPFNHKKGNSKSQQLSEDTTDNKKQNIVARHSRHSNDCNFFKRDSKQKPAKIQPSQSSPVSKNEKSEEEQTLIKKQRLNDEKMLRRNEFIKLEKKYVEKGLNSVENNRYYNLLELYPDFKKNTAEVKLQAHNNAVSNLEYALLIPQFRELFGKFGSGRVPYHCMTPFQKDLLFLDVSVVLISFMNKYFPGFQGEAYEAFDCILSWLKNEVKYEENFYWIFFGMGTFDEMNNKQFLMEVFMFAITKSSVCDSHFMECMWLNYIVTASWQKDFSKVVPFYFRETTLRIRNTSDVYKQIVEMFAHPSIIIIGYLGVPNDKYSTNLFN